MVEHGTGRRPGARLAAAATGLLILSAALVAPGPIQSALSQEPAMEPASTSVGAVTARLAWFYKPPRSASADVVVREFDTFVLSRGDESFRDRVRAARPSVRVRQYFLLSQIIKPDAGEAEGRNQAAYLPGDFERLWRDHRDWFLLRADGSPVVEGGKYYRMDPGSAGWRSFWISRVSAANPGWDGVFTDNTDLSLCGFERYGIRLQKYATDAAYTDAIAGFLRQIHDRFHVATGKPVVSNLVNGCSGRDARAKYLPWIQGSMDEGWAVDWGSGYLSTTRWRLDLYRAARQAASGKQVILVSQGSRTDYARQRFAFASYLLIADPRISFRYSYARQDGAYREPWLYDNYRARLGSPKGPRYEVANGWRRNFTHGHVIVNPSAHTARIVVS
jgi:hypothetical protein